MPKIKKLFEPIQIGTMELKNRLAMAPMGLRLLDEDGFPDEQCLEHYVRRADGGAGLVMVQACSILPEARSTVIPFHDDEYIPKLAKIAQGVKQHGAKISLEIVHHGILLAARRKSVKLKSLDEIQVIGPSPIPLPSNTVVHKQLTKEGGEPDAGIPREMTRQDIAHVIEGFAAAALRIRKAGFDAVQVSGGHGYLLNQFRSPRYNHRNDEYGGSVVNRARFVCEVIAAMRKKVGPDFPILLRLGGSDFSEGGVTIEDSVQQSPLFVEAGVDAIDVVGGSLESRQWVFPTYAMPPVPNLAAAEAIRKVVKVPVFVAGKMGEDIIAADRIVREGRIDGIVLGRALFADPDLPRKVASGQLEEVRPCLACNECHHITYQLQPIRCAVNAENGRESQVNANKPAEVKKKVLIVGGGPAGMEAARIAAIKGHEVILCEGRRQLGGLMLLGGVHNKRITALVKWMAAQIKKLPVEVRLKTEVTPALVAEIKPDVIILATGGTFQTLQVPGVKRTNVLSAHDLLKLMNGIPIDKGILLRAATLPLVRSLITAPMVRRFLGSNFPIKKNVAVIGGQFPGCSLAIALAENGKKVTIIEESDHYGEGMEEHIMIGLNTQVQEGKVQILTSTRVDAINNEEVAVIDDKGNKTQLASESVIIALELAPSDSNLAEELKGKVKEVYTIGDAKSFQRIIKAVAEGYDTAYNL